MDDHPWHVYTTWKLSFDRLTESTAILVRLCARLHHTGITEELFELAFLGLKDDDLSKPPIPFTQQESLACNFLNSFGANGVWDKSNFRWCIQEACSFSLLSYDIASRIYSIHPLYMIICNL